MRPSFSTVACPNWPLDRIAEQARDWGYLGIELRTFLLASTTLACEPALTDPAKVRRLLRHAGLSLESLATGLRFDEPCSPPVIGHLLARSRRCIDEARSAVGLGVALECPIVRVFGFEIIGSEKRSSAITRIADRLRLVADHCRNSGVRLAVENAGSFSTASQLAELLDAIDHPQAAASYSIPVAISAGENPRDGVNVLGERLVIARVKDMHEGVPCALGEGEIDCRPGVEALAERGFRGAVVFEYDRLWFPAAPACEDILARSARTLFAWSGAGSGTRASQPPHAAHA